MFKPEFLMCLGKVFAGAAVLAFAAARLIRVEHTLHPNSPESEPWQHYLSV